MAKFLLEFAY